MRSRAGIATAALGVLGVVLALVGVVLYVAVRSQADHPTLNAFERDGVAAARSDAVTFISLDGANADAQIAKLRAIATGPFRSKVTTVAAQLRTTLTGDRVSTTGSVKEAAVTGSDSALGTLSVLVAANQTVRNSADPKGEIRGYGLAMTMRRVDGHWLVYDLSFLS